MELSLFGIALMPVIVALVGLLKRLGLPADLAPYATGILAAGGYYLSQYVEWQPAASGQVEFWLSVMVVFLGASGFYAVGKYGREKLR